ncbi:MAG: hypothetical protein JST21_10945 [Bacteroidetes bacterium]|nr:hypothetical protein [Bacteroidota bacterium]
MKLKHVIFFSILLPISLYSQQKDSFIVEGKDTTVIIDKGTFTLKEVIVRNHMDYKSLLRRIQNDTTFYKAFRNLHIIEFSAYNNIRMLDKHNNPEASYFSKTRQLRNDGCRTTQTLEQKTTGDFLKPNGDFNYLTGEMYASIFLTKGKTCGETNIVAGREFSTAGKSGTDKHKEQLKMLFFEPGKKIPGIPFIGNKLDLYDDDAHQLYNYTLDYDSHNGQWVYIFTIKPKDDLGFFRRNNIVVDEMTTMFDAKTMEVVGRTYALSYHAGFYDFDVKIEVDMTHIGNLLVPETMRYKGNFSALTKKRERGEFTATLFDFKKE